MPDPTLAVPPPPDPIAYALKPGETTSEFWLTKLVVWAGLALTVLGMLTEALTAAGVLFPPGTTFGRYLAVAGIAVALVKTIVYNVLQVLKKIRVAEAAPLSRGSVEKALAIAVDGSKVAGLVLVLCLCSVARADDAAPADGGASAAAVVILAPSPAPSDPTRVLWTGAGTTAYGYYLPDATADHDAKELIECRQASLASRVPWWAWAAGSFLVGAGASLGGAYVYQRYSVAH